MKLKFGDITRFFGGLNAFASFILGATVFARRTRTKIIFSPLGRFMVKCGLSRANPTIDDLEKGKHYAVKKPFVDYRENRFEVGERLTFCRRDYLPFHGGNTLEFEEKSVYLQDEEQAEILRRIYDYIEPIR